MKRNGIMPVETMPESLKKCKQARVCKLGKWLSLSQLYHLLIIPTSQEFHGDKIRWSKQRTYSLVELSERYLWLLLTEHCGGHLDRPKSYRRYRKRNCQMVTCQFWEIQIITADTKDSPWLSSVTQHRQMINYIPCLKILPGRSAFHWRNGWRASIIGVDSV